MPAPRSELGNLVRGRAPTIDALGAWKDLWAEAKRVDMPDLAHRLGARLKQHGPHWTGPCPAGCAREDGFVVTPAKRLFYCRPSETRGDAVDMVMHAQGCTSAEALEYIIGTSKPSAGPAREVQRDAPRPATTTHDALALFSEGRDPRGTLVERYLTRERGLDLPADLCGEVLRWHPGAKAMLTLYRNIMTGEAQAVQRTFLDQDARKTGRKFVGRAALQRCSTPSTRCSGDCMSARASRHAWRLAGST
jgi:CHC2 zinc finger